MPPLVMGALYGALGSYALGLAVVAAVLLLCEPRAGGETLTWRVHEQRATMITKSEQRQLTQAECWVLLPTVRVGRLSYTEAAMPIVRAVPFVVDGGSVVTAVPCSPTRPDLFDTPTIVAFEAGEWATDLSTGWSVRFVGKAQVLSDHDLTDVALLALSPWIDSPPARHVRISAEILTGVTVTAR